MTVAVRRYRTEDRLRVLRLARNFHESQRSGMPPFDAPFADAQLRHRADDPSSLVLLLEADGIVQGALVAEVYTPALAPVRVAREIMWWVEPEYRGTGWLRMIREYESWARAAGASAAHLAHLAEDDGPAVLYRRLGYAPVETHYIRSL